MRVVRPEAILGQERVTYECDGETANGIATKKKTPFFGREKRKVNSDKNVRLRCTLQSPATIIYNIIIFCLPTADAVQFTASEFEYKYDIICYIVRTSER